MRQTFGRYTVVVEDNVIIARLAGSFNLDGIKAYTDRVKEIVTALNGAPFAMLIDDSEIEGGTPDAYAALNNYNEWMLGQNLVAKAFVLDNAAKRAILKTNTPALNNQNVDFFTQEEDARAWLQAELNKPRQ